MVSTGDDFPGIELMNFWTSSTGGGFSSSINGSADGCYAAAETWRGPTFIHKDCWEGNSKFLALVRTLISTHLVLSQKKYISDKPAFTWITCSISKCNLIFVEVASSLDNFFVRNTCMAIGYVVVASISASAPNVDEHEQVGMVWYSRV